MDYSARIDSETWQFIHRTDSFYPPETASFPIEKQRAIYDGMCREFFQGYPQGIVVADSLLAGVPCRHYQGPTPSAVRVVYFHGGGFVVGGLDSHDDVCAEICAQTGYRVVSVDYRMAPEHRAPVAVDDCVDATTWVQVSGGALRADTSRMAVAGDSAGGNLAAVTAIIGIIFYVAAVIATRLFGADFPQWFGTLGESAFTLFQIMTLESWSMGIVRPVMEVYPYAWAFFVPFIMVTTFAVVNLLVGLIVNSMQDAHAEEGNAATDAYRDEVLAKLDAIEKRLDAGGKRG